MKAYSKITIRSLQEIDRDIVKQQKELSRLRQRVPRNHNHYNRSSLFYYSFVQSKTKLANLKVRRSVIVYCLKLKHKRHGN